MCYKEVLKMNRYAMEALENLIEFNVDFNEIIKFYTDKQDEWIRIWIRSKYLKHQCKFKEALDELKILDKEIPNHLNTILEMGECKYRLSDFSDSISFFEKVYNSQLKKLKG